MTYPTNGGGRGEHRARSRLRWATSAVRSSSGGFEDAQAVQGDHLVRLGGTSPVNGFGRELPAAGRQVRSSSSGQDAGAASSSSMVRVRMIGEGSSHNRAREPPIAATTRVGAMPRNSPAMPPTTAPRGRIP